MSKRGVTLYLEDIKDAVRKIEKYTRGVDFDKFNKDEQLIDATVRNFSIIGEAAMNIPKAIITDNPDVAWKEMKGMRNKVVHEYFGIDEEILWKTIQDDIPVIKKQIAKLLRDSR
jgi:uncharacterized protein with HEPN domain